jgi:hypothetical protein
MQARRICILQASKTEITMEKIILAFQNITNKKASSATILSSLVKYQPLRSSVHETSEAGQRAFDFARPANA